MTDDMTPWVDADGERHEEQLPAAVIDAMGPAVFDPRPLVTASRGSETRDV